MCLNNQGLEAIHEKVSQIDSAVKEVNILLREHGLKNLFCVADIQSEIVKFQADLENYDKDKQNFTAEMFKKD